MTKNWLDRLTISDQIATQSHFNRTDIRCFREREENLYQLFLRSVKTAPDNDVVVFANSRVSYRELHREVTQLGHGLKGLGIQRGDRIALLMGNRPEFILCLLAIVRLGAIVVPINVRLQSDEITFLLSDSGANTLIVDSEGRERCPSPESLPSLQHLIGTPESEFDGNASWSSLFDQTPPPVPSTSDDSNVDEHDAALIMYTSGTTGKPKGAVVTHLGLIHAARQYVVCMALRPNERTIMAAPASHITGITANIVTMLAVQGCIIIMNRFDATAFVQLAQSERMTHTVMVPAMYNLCLLRVPIETFDLSAWRIGGYGGAPMPEATIERLAVCLPNLRLCNVYGATETTGPVTMVPFEETANVSDSVGLVMPCADVRIVDNAGQDVSNNGNGEVLIRGPNVVPGYWQNDQANLDNFVGGYWRSGDVGNIDDAGYLRLVDRLKDVINRGGYKIYSIEVENALNFHAKVVESAVIATPDPVLGEKCQAHVYTTDNDLDAGQLTEHCRERLADYKIPDYFVISKAPLPRNANGKLLKKSLRNE